MLDEFAAVPNAEEIMAATGDATPCRIFNSTPNAASGATFKRLRFPPPGKQGPKVLSMPWWLHPEKGEGRAQIVTPEGKLKWTSPWYERECARRMSHKEVAQEIDMNYLSAGDLFFDTDVLARIQAEDVREPDHRGELEFAVETIDLGRVYNIDLPIYKPDFGRRRLRLWCPILEEIDGNIRPRQNRNYVAFADIATGSGDSNSVLAVADVNSREIVAHFVDAFILPEEFAGYCAAICYWFGGQDYAPLLGWEANGGGGIFGRQIVRLGYPHLLRQRNERSPRREANRSLGWWSSRQGKIDLLSDFRRAIALREVVLRDAQSLVEHASYIYYPSGEVGPAELINEPGGARASHGDRTIAEAGAQLCMTERLAAGAPEIRPPAGSYAERRQRWEEKQRMLAREEEEWS